MYKRDVDARREFECSSSASEKDHNNNNSKKDQADEPRKDRKGNEENREEAQPQERKRRTSHTGPPVPTSRPSTPASSEAGVAPAATTSSINEKRAPPEQQQQQQQQEAPVQQSRQQQHEDQVKPPLPSQQQSKPQPPQPPQQQQRKVSPPKLKRKIKKKKSYVYPNEYVEWLFSESEESTSDDDDDENFNARQKRIQRRQLRQRILQSYAATASSSSSLVNSAPTTTTGTAASVGTTGGGAVGLSLASISDTLKKLTLDRALPCAALSSPVPLPSNNNNNSAGGGEVKGNPFFAEWSPSMLNFYEEFGKTICSCWVRVHIGDTTLRRNEDVLPRRRFLRLKGFNYLFFYNTDTEEAPQYFVSLKDCSVTLGRYSNSVRVCPLEPEGKKQKEARSSSAHSTTAAPISRNEDPGATIYSQQQQQQQEEDNNGGLSLVCEATEKALTIVCERAEDFVVVYATMVKRKQQTYMFQARSRAALKQAEKERERQKRKQEFEELKAGDDGLEGALRGYPQDTARHQRLYPLNEYAPSSSEQPERLVIVDERMYLRSNANLLPSSSSSEHQFFPSQGGVAEERLCAAVSYYSTQQAIVVHWIPLHPMHFSCENCFPNKDEHIIHCGAGRQEESEGQKGGILFCKQSLSELSFGQALGDDVFGKIYPAQHLASKTLYWVRGLRKDTMTFHVDEQTLLKISRLPFLQAIHKIFCDEKKMYLLMSPWGQCSSLAYWMQASSQHALSSRTTSDGYQRPPDEPMTGTTTTATIYMMFNPQRVHFYMTELVLTLSLLHSRGVCVGCLSPSRVMLDTSEHIQLFGIGISTVYWAIEQCHAEVLEYLSPRYVSHYLNILQNRFDCFAPESLNEERESGCMRGGGPWCVEDVEGGMLGEALATQHVAFDMCDDWWSLGILMFRLISGESFYLSSKDTDEEKEEMERGEDVFAQQQQMRRRQAGKRRKNKKTSLTSKQILKIMQKLVTPPLADDEASALKMIHPFVVERVKSIPASRCSMYAKEVLLRLLDTRNFFTVRHQQQQQQQTQMKNENITTTTKGGNTALPRKQSNVIAPTAATKKIDTEKGIQRDFVLRDLMCCPYFQPVDWIAVFHKKNAPPRTMLIRNPVASSFFNAPPETAAAGAVPMHSINCNKIGTTATISRGMKEAVFQEEELLRKRTPSPQTARTSSNNNGKTAPGAFLPTFAHQYPYGKEKQNFAVSSLAFTSKRTPQHQLKKKNSDQFLRQTLVPFLIKTSKVEALREALTTELRRKKEAEENGNFWGEGLRERKGGGNSSRHSSIPRHHQHPYGRSTSRESRHSQQQGRRTNSSSKQTAGGSNRGESPWGRADAGAGGAANTGFRSSRAATPTSLDVLAAPKQHAHAAEEAERVNSRRGKNEDNHRDLWKHPKYAVIQSRYKLPPAPRPHPGAYKPPEKLPPTFGDPPPIPSSRTSSCEKGSYYYRNVSPRVDCRNENYAGMPAALAAAAVHPRGSSPPSTHEEEEEEKQRRPKEGKEEQCLKGKGLHVDPTAQCTGPITAGKIVQETQRTSSTKSKEEKVPAAKQQQRNHLSTAASSKQKTRNTTPPLPTRIRPSSPATGTSSSSSRRGQEINNMKKKKEEKNAPSKKIDTAAAEVSSLRSQERWERERHHGQEHQHVDRTQEKLVEDGLPKRKSTLDMEENIEVSPIDKEEKEPSAQPPPQVPPPPEHIIAEESTYIFESPKPPLSASALAVTENNKGGNSVQQGEGVSISNEDDDGRKSGSGHIVTESAESQYQEQKVAAGKQQASSPQHKQQRKEEGVPQSNSSIASSSSPNSHSPSPTYGSPPKPTQRHSSSAHGHIQKQQQQQEIPVQIAAQQQRSNDQAQVQRRDSIASQDSADIIEVVDDELEAQEMFHEYPPPQPQQQQQQQLKKEQQPKSKFEKFRQEENDANNTSITTASQDSMSNSAVVLQPDPVAPLDLSPPRPKLPPPPPPPPSSGAALSRAKAQKNTRNVPITTADGDTVATGTYVSQQQQQQFVMDEQHQPQLQRRVSARDRLQRQYQTGSATVVLHNVPPQSSSDPAPHPSSS